MTSNRQKLKRITTHLAEPQVEWLRQIAKKTGLPVAEHIRRAIDEYLKHMERE